MKRKALPKLRKLIHRHQRWACWEDGWDYITKFRPLKAHTAVKRRRNGAAKRAQVMAKQQVTRDAAAAVRAAAESHRKWLESCPQVAWTVYDEAYGYRLGVVLARTEWEAEQAAAIQLAESGRDREADYDGFYVCQGE